MAEWEVAFADKPDNLGLNPGSHTVEEGNWFPYVILWYTYAWHVCIQLPTQPNSKQINIIFKRHYTKFLFLT